MTQTPGDGDTDPTPDGLPQRGDITEFLEENFQSGETVEIPPGEYEFTGEGLEGEYEDAHLIGSPMGVVFRRPDDPEETVRPDIVATDGTVTIENITVKGKHGQEQSRFRLDAEAGATIEAKNLNFPDGTVDESDSTGIYAGEEHAGTLKITDCYFSGFGNVACYVSDPYKGGNGQVIVDNCAFVNTGMASLRFASDNSVCRNCYFEATEKAPAGNTGWNQRGIKIDDAGEDVLFENIDMYWTDAGTIPVKFDEDGEGGSGTFRNVRIYDSTDRLTFDVEWDISDNWRGENIHLTGPKADDIVEEFEVVANPETPDRDYEQWSAGGIFL